MEQSEIISYCGLNCSRCPIYLATTEPDSAKQIRMRIEIAELCNSKYGKNYTYADINDCMGCLSLSGEIFSGCLQCKVRTCAQFREVKNCAECPDYICAILDDIYIIDNTGKKTLDSIRGGSK